MGAKGKGGKIRCVVLDFDGTFTDVHEEARDFPAAYRADVADLLGHDVSDAWAEAERTIAADPDHYGWDFEGKLVAPANADPYILSSAIANLVFQKFGVLRSHRLRSDVAQLIYKSAYEKTRTAFRPHARDVLEALVGSGLPVTIVTNAHTAMVKKKLDDLGIPEGKRPRLHGEAKKFIAGALEKPDPAFDALPETAAIPGLARPVYLRRAHYYQALRSIWDENPGTSPSNTLVCGDIYELDLALPAHLGADVHLVTRGGTNGYERQAVSALGPRGGLGDDLREILSRIG